MKKQVFNAIAGELSPLLLVLPAEPFESNDVWRKHLSFPLPSGVGEQLVRPDISQQDGA